MKPDGCGRSADVENHLDSLALHLVQDLVEPFRVNDPPADGRFRQTAVPTRAIPDVPPHSAQEGVRWPDIQQWRFESLARPFERNQDDIVGAHGQRELVGTAVSDLDHAIGFRQVACQLR